MSVKLTGFVVLMATVFVGCAPPDHLRPENYQPITANEDPGPWPIAFHNHLYSYWMSAGPYRTNWRGQQVYSKEEKTPTITELTTIQPVSHTDKSLATELELVGPDGTAVLLRGFAEPQPKTLKLGKVDIPLDISYELINGNICTVNHELATFNVQIQNLKEGETVGQISLPDRTIVIVQTPEPEKTFLQKIASEGIWSYDFMDGSKRVGRIEWRPSKQIWVDPELPEDAELSVATVAAFVALRCEFIERQQAASQTVIYVPAG